MLSSLIVSSSQIEYLDRAAAAYAANVDLAAPYLVSRGIGQQAALGSRLGFVATPEPGHERFRGMVSIPYLLPVGVVAFKFRRLQGEGKKYDSPVGQHSRLYNAGVLASGGDLVAVCEGEFDAIKVQQDLGIPAVAVPGTDNWRPHMARCFADWDRVIVFADHDVKENGSDPGLKHAKRLVKEIANAELVIPPGRADVTEWLMSEGVDRVREASGL